MSLHTVCDKLFFFVMHLEDVEHLFYYWPYSLSFWIAFKMDTTKRFLRNTFHLEPWDILHGLQNPYLSDKQIYILNFFIILDKFYIHKTRITHSKASYITLSRTDLDFYFKTILNVEAQKKKLYLIVLHYIRVSLVLYISVSQWTTFT